MDYSKANFHYARIEAELAKTSSINQLHAAIVNSPFKVDKMATALIFLGIIVYLKVNYKTKTIDRISLTDNEFARAAVTVSAKKFEDIKIPLNSQQNIISQAIDRLVPTRTTDWSNLFVPELTSTQARINQASTGIAYSSVYPIIGLKEGAALIFSFYQYPEKIGKQQIEFMENYSALVAKILRR